MKVKYCSFTRSVIIIVLFLGVAVRGYTQKHDYHWLNGYDAEYGGIFGNFELNFHNQPVTIDPIEFNNADLSDQVTSFSNADGKLLLVSNGCRLFDALGHVLPGGDTLNPGEIYNSWCKNNGSYPVMFNMIMLPQENCVYLFHNRVVLDSQFGITLTPSYLSKVDLGGDSITTEFTNNIVSTTKVESPAACKHGNGRDWIIMTPEHRKATYRTYVLDIDGIQSLNTQTIGYQYPYPECDAYGLHSFSPDGTKYVRYNNTCGLSFFDFDRCTGELSNERLISLPEVFKPGAFTVFSSNSRYCYYNSSRVIMQVDMEDAILQPDTIAILDTFPTPTGAGFVMMQRGPDGRIYISPGSSTQTYHVIEYPDLKGKACWARPNAIPLPYLSFLALPNIPNYRLGAWKDSPCDTLGLSEVPSEIPSSFGHRIYPNPVQDGFTLELDEGLQHAFAWQLEVFDLAGRMVYQGSIPPYAFLHRVQSGSWSSGMYYAVLRDETGTILAVDKLVKME
ncbi:MAG: T9SS type A sorting domain-containing protein [Saprospiraceae bacterium]